MTFEGQFSYWKADSVPVPQKYNIRHIIQVI